MKWIFNADLPINASTQEKLYEFEALEAALTSKKTRDCPFGTCSKHSRSAEPEPPTEQIILDVHSLFSVILSMHVPPVVLYCLIICLSYLTLKTDS